MLVFYDGFQARLIVVSKVDRSWGAFFRQALVLWGAGVVGYIALVPYLLVLLGDRFRATAELAGVSLTTIVVLSGIQNAIFTGICVVVGLLCAPRVGLRAPLSASLVGAEEVDLRAWFQGMVRPSLSWGFGLAVLVIALDLGLRPWTPEGLSGGAEMSPTWWQGLLASFYGGIAEELQLRLGLLTLIAWVLHRLFAKAKDGLPDWIFWTANLIAALLFGAGHLPSAAALVPLTGFVIFRTLLLNGVLAVAFGVLYRRYGLEAAILSHFTAGIMLHVIPALFMG
jgi:hypothetical protein